MELLICGTAAAEGWPALFCSCEPCRKARELGGKNLRSRAAYMLGEKIRIDFGPDSLYHQQRYGLAYDRVEALLMTHAHEDHWLAHELYYRRPGFSIVPETDRMGVYGNARIGEQLAGITGGDEDQFRLRFEEIEPFKAIALTEGARATPIPADHDRSQRCVNYMIELAGRRLLIAHDSGWYDEPSWQFLAGKPLDLVIVDCTNGSLEGRRGHMGCAAVCDFRDRLREQGSLAPDARVIATHFSHNGVWLHHELEAYLNPRGIEVAFDGMRVEVSG